MAIMWSPKCACTSIVDYASHCNFDYNKDEIVKRDYSTQKSTSNHRKALNEHNFKMGFQQVSELVKSGECESIAISTRDPASRLSSAFVNKFLVSHGKPKYPDRIFSENSLWPRRLVEQCAEIRYPGIPIPKAQGKNVDICLAQLFMYITDERVELDNINSHFAPQLIHKSSFQNLKKLMSCTQLFWIRTEHFADDLSFINHSLEVPNYIPPRTNESSLPTGWTKSSEVKNAFSQISELTESKIVPSREVTVKLIEDNKIRFENKWSLDLRLMKYLNRNSKHS